MLSEIYKSWNMPKEAEFHLDEAAKAVPEWRGFQAEWHMDVWDRELRALLRPRLAVNTGA